MSPSSASRPTHPRPTQSRRGTVYAGLVVVAVLALVVSGVVWQQQRSAPVNPDYGATKAAVSVTDGVVRIGAADAPAVIDVYEDFLCPACAQFEAQYGGALAQAMDEGAVAVRFHLVDFLGPRSASGDYSRRAAAASLCVAADGDGSAYPDFHSTLYSQDVIPQENGDRDHTDDELVAMAVQAGASDAVGQCVAGGGQLTTVDQVTETAVTDIGAAAGADNVGTPTVLRDGQVVDRTDRDWVAKLT